MNQMLVSALACNKISEIYTPSDDQSAAFSMSSTVKPDKRALEVVAALTEWAWNFDVSTPAFLRQTLSHLAMVLELTGP